MWASDLSGDGIHPNDFGYKLFASVWWKAISKLESQIQPPSSSTGVGDTALTSGGTCTKLANNARGPIKSQQGSGHDDGNYVHNRVERGVIESARIEKRSEPRSITDAIPWHVFFAKIMVGNPNWQRNEALDVWIRIFHDTATGKNMYYYRQNLGGGKFGPSTTFDVEQNSDSGSLYAFADFNNDGLDDFYCLKLGSALVVSLNRGGNPPKFESIGQVVPAHNGFVAADVRIADIDGDARADYCLTRCDASVVCSRNGGQGDKYRWQGLSTLGGLRGVVFDKKNGVDKAFGDINGDFRSDMLYIGDKDDVETRINSRGWNAGIVPEWRKVGTTHLG
jgi:FG-GAP-like repeat